MAAVTETGGLSQSEVWWRDRYRALESCGYKLRPRYHPDWVPSWKMSGKEFWTVEDGQSPQVSVVRLISFMPSNLALVTYNDGRSAQGRNAGGTQEGLCKRRTGKFEDGPKVLFARSQGPSQ